MAKSRSEPGECKPVDGAASNPPGSASENKKNWPEPYRYQEARLSVYIT